MPPPSLGYVPKFPLPSLGRLYSILEGQEQLKEQLQVMFKTRTLNWIDSLPKSRSDNFFFIIFYLFNAFHIGIATFSEHIEFASVFFCSPVL